MTGGRFLKADKQLPIAIQPGMRALDHPSAGAMARIAYLGPLLLTTRANLRNVVPLADRPVGGMPCVSFVGTQVLPGSLLPARTLNHDVVHRRLQQLHVVSMSAAHD
jgi:hypothetical protein